MKELIKKLKLKVTDHLIERMIERNVSKQDVVNCFSKHVIKPGKNPETIKLVGRSVTIVVTKSRELLTAYRN